LQHQYRLPEHHELHITHDMVNMTCYYFTIWALPSCPLLFKLPTPFIPLEGMPQIQVYK
jgi:hypothetical protein